MNYLTLLCGILMSTTTYASSFDNLWDFSDPSGTQKKFQALEHEAKNWQLDERLQLQTQIARSLGLQRKFAEAHEGLDGVEKQLSAKTPIAQVRYQLEKGRVYNSNKEASKALPFFSKAYDLALAHKAENLTVDAAHMMAIAEPTPEKQMEWNLKAVALAEKAADPKARDWIGSLYNNIGWTYHDQGKFEAALDMFQKALVFRESKKNPETIRIAKWSVARVLRSLKRNEEALKVQLALEQESQALPQKDGYVFEELGELYLALDKKAESKKYFKLAYDELSKDEWVKANESKKLERFIELSR